MKREAQTPESPGENLDALLSAFFRAELPKPWPAFRAPARRPRVAPRLAQGFGDARGSGGVIAPGAPGPTLRWSSRLALAAAVVLLLLGAWLAPGPSAVSVSGGRPGNLPVIGEPGATRNDGHEQGGAPAKPRKRPADKRAAPRPPQR
jgi:hypothetical protein